jgi:hypothetical protein
MHKEAAGVKFTIQWKAVKLTIRVQKSPVKNYLYVSPITERPFPLVLHFRDDRNTLQKKKCYT